MGCLGYAVQRERASPYDVAIADFSGDSQLDILVGHCTGTNLYFGASGPAFVRGDVDVDQSVNTADAVFIFAALFLPGSPQPLCPDAADVDYAGTIDMADGILLLSSAVRELTSAHGLAAIRQSRAGFLRKYASDR